MTAPTIYLTEEERHLVRAQRVRISERGGEKAHVVLRPRADGEVDVVYAFSRLVRENGGRRIDVMACGLTSSDGDRIAYRNLRFYPRAGYHVDDWSKPVDGNAWGYNKTRDDGTDEIPGPVANPEALASTKYHHAGIDEFCWGIRPAAYLRILRAHPEAELLHKAGMDQLISSAFLSHGPELARFVAANRREIEELDAGRAAVLAAFRKGIPVAAAVREGKACARLRGCKRPKGVGWIELDNWLRRGGIPVGAYAMHSQHCEKLKLGKGAYMPSPKRFRAVAEEVEALYAKRMTELARMANSKRDKSIAKRAGMLSALAVRLPTGIVLAFPDSVGALEAEGHVMRNCIGNGLYATNIARGVSLCIFIRRAENPERPFCDAELTLAKRTWKVRQCYTIGNEKAPDEAREAATALCAALNKEQRKRRSNLKKGA